MLDLLSGLVPRALMSSDISPAAVFRLIEECRPSLLLDEVETHLFNEKPDKSELRGILNCGHHRAGAFVERVDGQNLEPRPFGTWAPKAFALVGRLPATSEDRSIILHLRRKKASETVERLRLGRLGELESLGQRAARWALDHIDELKHADPAVPDNIASDRARDNWRSLLAIADATGGPWPEKGRKAVERKELDDLVACLMGANCERFERELMRLSRLQLACVVVEAALADVRAGRYRAQMRPESVAQSIFAFQVRYRVPFLFCGDRAGGEYVTFGLLQKFAREIEERFEALTKAERQAGALSSRLSDPRASLGGRS